MASALTPSLCSGLGCGVWLKGTWGPILSRFPEPMQPQEHALLSLRHLLGACFDCPPPPSSVSPAGMAALVVDPGAGLAPSAGWLRGI